MASPRVHLVRHGEVENPDGVVYGSLPGFGLSALGHAQATAAGRYLATQATTRPLILASPLQRTQETAALVRAALDGGSQEIAIAPELIEAGAFLEGLPRRFAPLRYAERLLDPEARARIESPRRVRARMRAAVLRAIEAAADRDVILISHQFPIWMATHAFEYPHRVHEWMPWLVARRPCAPASVTTLTFGPAQRVTIDYWAP